MDQLEVEAANARTAYEKKNKDFLAKWVKGVHNELINNEDE